MRAPAIPPVLPPFCAGPLTESQRVARACVVGSADSSRHMRAAPCQAAYRRASREGGTDMVSDADHRTTPVASRSSRRKRRSKPGNSVEPPHGATSWGMPSGSASRAAVPLGATDGPGASVGLPSALMADDNAESEGLVTVTILWSQMRAPGALVRFFFLLRTDEPSSR